MKKIIFFGAILAPFLVFSQQLNTRQLNRLTELHWQKGLDLLQEIVAVPNDAAIASDLGETERLMTKAFASRGFELERLETDGVPLLLATYEPKKRFSGSTLLLYFHADGQAVDPSRWFQNDPYEIVLKQRSESSDWETLDIDLLSSSYDPNWRLFGRSTSDAKGPIVMFLTAFDALVAQNKLTSNRIKVVIDLEEEQGSPSLPEAVARYKEKLMADAMLIFDGPRHVSNRPTLTYGARGIASITLKTFGPRLPQHSGHYGNYAPNPALALSQLLASMKDPEGRVLIEGYYDNIVLSAYDKEQLAKIPDDEVALRRRLGFSKADEVAGTYQESLQYPSLNIRGLQSAYVGASARTIVPAIATAEIDVRLVPESEPYRLMQLIKSHIENQGFTVLDHEPSDEERQQFDRIVQLSSKVSYAAFRTDMNSPIGEWLRSQMNRAGFEDLVQLRLMGGSIPISPFVEALGIDAVIIPTVNADNNQHSPNENIRLENFREGIITMLSLLSAQGL